MPKVSFSFPAVMVYLIRPHGQLVLSAQVSISGSVAETWIIVSPVFAPSSTTALYAISVKAGLFLFSTNTKLIN